ncbi:MAG: aminotransferase class V-fold PLP-dependent enzyme [Candidatus Omnitrophica bacterium]|nr:aminotransferase class V-fold PLP-dependent enzyme [Candidatus Omnitrophota bacterium]
MIYLDNAATSFPKPQAVYDRIATFMKEQGANPGRSGYRLATDCEKMIGAARHEITRFFGGEDSERLIFCMNATDALNIAIKGVLRQGDHVVTTHLEHNSVSRPLNRLEHDGVIEITRVMHNSEGVVDPVEIRQAVKANTRLVALTHASNVLGTIQPVAEIGRLVAETEAFFLVDSAQTAGVVEINAKEMKIDLLAFPGHKALFGPTGTGGLLVGPGIDVAVFREGGTGGDSSSPLQPEGYPHRLEGGTPNTLGIAALLEGVRFVAAEGCAKILQHEQALIARFLGALQGVSPITVYGSKNPAHHVGTVSVNLSSISPQEAGTILDQSFGIAVRSGLHCAPYAHRSIGTYPEGTLRFSPGYFNTAEEIDAASAALAKLAASF